MKKFTAILITLCLVLCAFACGNNDAGKGSDLPVSPEMFGEITKAYDSRLIVKEVSASDTKTQYSLYFPEYPQMEIAGVTTGINDGTGILNMTFASGTGMAETIGTEPYKSNPITTENIKETLIYAAKLYGLENENAIYDAFAKTTPEEKDSGTGYKSYTYKFESEGSDCRISFNEPDGSGVKVLFTISVTSK